MRALLSALLLWLTALPALAATSVPVDTGRVVATLLSSHYAVTPGQSFDVALRTELDAGWHTYWRNPGDSGEPVSITWNLPDGAQASAITWPLPEPIATGPIINYGFEGAPLFPVTITAPEDAEPGSVMELVADVYYLVCADICVPEDGQLRVAVSIADAPEVNARNAAAIEAALAAAPSEAVVRGGITTAGGVTRIEFDGLPDGAYGDAYFFPYAQDVLDHSAAQAATPVDGGVVIETAPGFGWEEGIAGAQAGVLAFDLNGERVGRIVSAEPNTSLGLVAAPAARPGQLGLLTAVLFAFAGGLILNLMPCVFPVISLKALSLAKSAHAERQRARAEAWMYAAGVLATFAVLVALILSLKAGGAALGWGFQLQNPVVTGGLALLLFAVGLNLVGAFEVAGGAYQGAGASWAGKGGRTGSFFTGALAVLVATPCTAPFMASAIGYALAQPAAVTLAVFMALAAGFAAPFVLLAYAPGLLTRLPRPGPWMVRLREVLSFPMFAASLWLVWVVGNQAGVNGMALVLLAMLGVALAVWLLRRGGAWKLAAAALALVALVLPVPALLSGSPAQAADTELAYDAWSPERVAELRSEGRAVFVDFTADWCVTCKLNEGAVLKTQAVQRALEDTDTAFLVGDWTNKNDAIARELERYGRAGVPLYLYFPAGDKSVRGEVLPQILTVPMVVDTLRGS